MSNTSSPALASLSSIDRAPRDCDDSSTSHFVPECPAPEDEKRAATAVTDDPAELTDRQLAAIELIASGATDTAVAEALHVNRRSVYRWRVEDPEFRAHLSKRRAELYANSVDRLRAMLNQALNTLEQQISDPYTTTSLRAARTLLVMARVGSAVAASEQNEPSKSAPQINREKGATTDEHG